MKITEQLSNAYFSTEYRVFDPIAGVILLRASGQSKDLAGLYASHSGAQSCAFLTAYNPLSEQVDDAANKKAQEDLIADVERQWHYMLGEGADPKGEWPPEPSILIFDISLEEARELAQKYGQNAFLFGDDRGYTQLIATNPDEQHILIHPLQRATEQINRSLEEQGFVVTKKKADPNSPVTASFVPRRRQGDE